ncbi:hypothetical protein G2912_07130 [Paraburkholderia aspalathi]|nr:hypothetical protein [Paraburkholderia aspalathi]
MSEQQKIPMRPIIPSRKSGLVEPIGIGTGLVEASSSLWKRAAERLSVRFGDLVKWAFDEQRISVDDPHKVRGQDTIRHQFYEVDGITGGAMVYLVPLESLLESSHIEACTLLPFTGFLSASRLLRRYRAWCPMCLVSMLSGPGAYEPLLWRLQDATVCPVHGVDLAESCHVCTAPHQELFGRYARVGCCNKCGAWMGTKDAVRGLRRADEYEVGVSRTLMSLLAWTAEFEGHGHDGRSTLQKLMQVSGVRDLLISKLGVSRKTISSYRCVPRLPRLAVLATVASGSQQPLHRVILGHLVPWSDANMPSMDMSNVRRQRDWTALEREFGVLANGPTFINLKDACKQINISQPTARKRFPDLAARIAGRTKVFRSERAAVRRQEKLTRVREAFRMLTAADEYPSHWKLQNISGVSARCISVTFKDLIDEEWLRAEGNTHFRRKSVPLQFMNRT